jgi:hypothetical protein
LLQRPPILRNLPLKIETREVLLDHHSECSIGRDRRLEACALQLLIRLGQRQSLNVRGTAQVLASNPTMASAAVMTAARTIL